MFSTRTGLALLLLFPALLGGIKANAQPIDGNICPGESQVHRMARSRNFFLYVCAEENQPTYYVGTAKNGSGTIILPLSSVKGEVYTARNKGHVYVLDFDRQRLTIIFPSGRKVVQSVEQVYD
ncbi:hypothetical protein H6F50_09025 [Coleofasciculus sp. FACHB-712]|uniref:hypothetical protein n=1 Tax=Coleofasciculus sp. FACHB-712 TaxID=2692789 RepID=UPI0016841502|nr:hypothetical protein [Coleofasciculus sp. FACHB-712]MBD1942495.1 hypothetical protein [Coleofasciculus sp. FACHB-712]